MKEMLLALTRAEILAFLIALLMTACAVLLVLALVRLFGPGGRELPREKRLSLWLSVATMLVFLAALLFSFPTFR